MNIPNTTTQNISINSNYNINSSEEEKGSSKTISRRTESCRDDIIDVARKITWLHGTNSSIQALLPYTDYTLIPTGKLLDKGISPMCGEISNGGMQTNGVNQHRISVWTIENIKEGWEYANIISNTFKPRYFDEPEKVFLSHLENLEELTPNSDSWDPTLVKLFQLKQWNPDVFVQLCKKHQEKISLIQSSITQSHSSEEMMVIKALEYDTNKLVKAISDEKVKEEVEKDLPYLKKVLKPGWTKCEEYVNCHLRNLNLDESELGLGNWSYRFKKDFELNCMDIIFVKMFGQKKVDEVKEMIQTEKDLPEFILNKWQAYRKYGSSNDPKIELILKNAITPRIEALIKKNTLPYKKRLKRFEQLFNDLPTIKFSEKDASNLTNPYPMLLASTKQNIIAFNGASRGEYHVKNSKLGDDIDIIFVKDEHASHLQNWLKTNKLSGYVKVFSYTTINDIKEAKLTHNDKNVQFKGKFIDDRDLNKVNNILNQHVIPIYNTPYPDGSNREWHGVMHSVRATLFSHVLASLYDDEGHEVKSYPINLMTAVAMHDSAREDDGVDLWDKQSGQKFKQLLEKVGKDLKDGEIELLEHAIAEKDNDNPTSLEQKIVHDADSIEILRCLYREDDFQENKLWITKDLDPDTARQLVTEAKIFIKLTKNPMIKKFVETSGNPLSCLYCILFHANEHYDKFHIMCNSVWFAAAGHVTTPENYMLTSEIETIIKRQLHNS